MLFSQLEKFYCVTRWLQPTEKYNQTTTVCPGELTTSFIVKIKYIK